MAKTDVPIHAGIHGIGNLTAAPACATGCARRSVVVSPPAPACMSPIVVFADAIGSDATTALATVAHIGWQRSEWSAALRIERVSETARADRGAGACTCTAGGALVLPGVIGGGVWHSWECGEALALAGDFLAAWPRYRGSLRSLAIWALPHRSGADRVCESQGVACADRDGAAEPRQHLLHAS